MDYPNQTLNDLLRETLATHSEREHSGEPPNPEAALIEAIQRCVRETAHDLMADATGLQVSLCQGLYDELTHPESVDTSSNGLVDARSALFKALLEREGVESAEILRGTSEGMTIHSLVAPACALFRTLRDKADKTPAEKAYLSMVRQIVGQEAPSEEPFLEEGSDADDKLLGRSLYRFEQKLKEVFFEMFSERSAHEQAVIRFIQRAKTLENKATRYGSRPASRHILVEGFKQLQQAIEKIIQQESSSSSQGKIDFDLIRSETPGLDRRWDFVETFDFFVDHLPRYLEEINNHFDRIERDHQEAERRLDEQEEADRQRRMNQEVQQESKRRRRERLESIANQLGVVFSITAIGLSGIAIVKQHGWDDEIRQGIQETTERLKNRIRSFPKTEAAPPKTAPPETAEVQKTESPFGTVLEASLPIWLSKTRTWKDNILDSYTVSEYFLNGRYHYLGQQRGQYQDKKQPIYRFAQIGEKSGQLGRNGEGRDRWKTTTLVNTINTLLDVERLSEEQIRDWVVWMYTTSFRVTLIPERLHVRKQGKEVEAVEYAAEKDFKSNIPVSVNRMRADDRATRPGGASSVEWEYQPLIGKGNRLLLPSGLSPSHDIAVPETLMKKNPSFTLSLNGYGSWDNWTAADLVGRLQMVKEDPKPKERSKAKAYGREFNYAKMPSNLGQANDGRMKTLAGFLLKDIPKTQHVARIQRIIAFVQDFPYRYEYDTDLDRDGLISLFNGGRDCNNVVILWGQLMLAAGYDAAFLRVDKKKLDMETHVMGGIPAKYYPQGQYTTWFSDKKEEWIPIELTNKGWGLGEPEMGEDHDSTVFAIQVVRAPHKAQ